MDFPKFWRVLRTYDGGFSSLIKEDHHRNVNPPTAVAEMFDLLQ